MTSSGAPAAYTNADNQLFDLPGPTHTTDQRSFKELLLDVDRRARMLLIDVTEDDAAPLLQAWPGLVSAAVTLWQTIPRRAGPASGAATLIERVAEISDSISRRSTATAWPPSAAADPRLSDMARTLDHAASLLEQSAARAPVSHPAREDLDAAQARIMHSLYVTAHAVTVSLVQHGRARHDQAAATPRPLATPNGQVPDAVAPTTEWVRRMAAAEAAAASFAAPGRLPALLNGEQHVAPADPSRLSRAMAQWDVQAHRGLVSPDWRDNMVLITRTQALVAGTTMVLVNAAATGDGKLDPTPRLVPALSRAGAAWSDLGSRWADLTPLHVRPSPQLLLAAHEIRGATRDLTHAGATMASLDTIAGRPELHDALGALLHGLEHADELAHAVAEKAGAPGLTGRARALSIRAHNEVEATHVATGHIFCPLGSDHVWVSPTAIVKKQMVAAPAPVIEGIQASSQIVIQTAARAGAIASVGVPSLPPRHEDSSGRANRDGPPTQDRSPGGSAVVKAQGLRHVTQKPSPRNGGRDAFPLRPRSVQPLR